MSPAAEWISYHSDLLICLCVFVDLWENTKRCLWMLPVLNSSVCPVWGHTCVQTDGKPSYEASWIQALLKGF